MLTVACVLRSGGIYNATWVDALRRGVEKHLRTPHFFVCLTDMEVDCEKIPLVTEWGRWWAKLELFRPGLFDGPVLYFDLDTVIVGDLAKLADYPHHFTMAHEYYRPRQKCSTAMAWNGRYDFGLFQAFDPKLHMPIYTRHGRIGDQAYIEEHLAARGEPVDTFRDLFGETSIASYKVHQCHKGVPKGTAAVAFHGKPKPHEVNHDWVRESWR